MTGSILRVGYGFLFVIVIPGILVLWARRLDGLLALPGWHVPSAGWVLAAIGATLMLAATRDLWVHGRGLPMSPFPPERLVTRGTYALIAHPIYVGAVILAAGVSFAAGSAAGLWIVTPVVGLGAAALVFGYERDATLRRLGAVAGPVLALPPDSDGPVTAAQRAAVYVLVLAPWLALYEAVELLGPAPDARTAFLPFEAGIPVYPWTEPVYISAYFLGVLAPLAAKRQSDLRRFALDGLWATLLILPVYLLLPLIVPAKPVPGDGLWQTVMRWERAIDRPVTAFPAFHVVWSCIAAQFLSATWPRFRAAWWLLAFAIAVSCVTVGMHAIADVAAGFVAYVIVTRRRAVWRRLCNGAEVVANSWHEWSLGGMRFINHGLYPALGVVAGLSAALALVDAQHRGWLALATLSAVLGAGLWAQIVEGSPQLLRPYGYFGGVLAVVATALVAGALGGDGWVVLAAMGVAASLAQPFGRLRCLVQGCCHGHEAPDALGIRYTHPRSRVLRLSTLGGLPVHPTPLYSIVWTLFVALVLLRLWALAAPLALIAGFYFILIGLGRFVEEHYRGEPQTLVVGGLRLYQWLAIAFVVGGAAVTTLPSRPAPQPAGFGLVDAAFIALLGVVSAAAFGLDFPASNRRFSRLA